MVVGTLLLDTKTPKFDTTIALLLCLQNLQSPVISAGVSLCTDGRCDGLPLSRCLLLCPSRVWWCECTKWCSVRSKEVMKCAITLNGIVLSWLIVRMRERWLTFANWPQMLFRRKCESEENLRTRMGRKVERWSRRHHVLFTHTHNEINHTKRLTTMNFDDLLRCLRAGAAKNVRWPNSNSSGSMCR